MSKDRIMTRQINSIVGHFVAECNLDKMVTIIRDPRKGYRPVAFVPSVEKADVLQAIRRVGQKAKLEQSFELLGMQAIAEEAEINFDKAEEFIRKNKNSSGSGKERTRVNTPLKAGGSLPDSEPVKIKKAAPPAAAPKTKEKIKVAKAPAKKVGKEHGW
jgi:hypothetical protein